MLMTETKNRVREIAADLGMSFNRFASRCLWYDLSYETAKDIWYGVERPRGYNAGTKSIVAKVLRRPVTEVFPED
jgi:hypothetical protein